MKTKSTHRLSYPKNPAATNARSFRSFLLMQQFAAGEIGERIAQARKEADAMTQEQLAELLNVSTRSIQDYEAGVTIPWKYFSRLETVFKRPLGWFLYGDESPHPQGIDQRVDALREDIAELTALVASLVGREAS